MKSIIIIFYQKSIDFLKREARFYEQTPMIKFKDKAYLGFGIYFGFRY